MPTVPIIPPFRGVTSKGAFIQTPGGYAPPGGMVNVRPTSVSSGRGQIARRPGTRKLFDQQIGGGMPVQAIAQLSRASAVSGYTRGACYPVGTEWETRTSGTLAGHVWGFDGRRGMAFDVSIGTAALQRPAFGISVSRDGTRAAYCLTDNTVSPRESYVRVISMVDGSEIALIGPINEAPTDAFLNLTCWGGSGSADDFLFVTINGKIRAYRTDTWAAQSTSTCNGHAFEVTGIAVAPGGGTLYALFDGNNTAGTLPNAGPAAITAGEYAKMFRAGVMRFTINARTALGSALTQVSFGQQLSSGATFYESSHGYFRFSEQFDWAPQGCKTRSIAAHPSGGVIVGHTNRGTGPNGSYPATFSPFTTLTRINASGGIAWQADTESYLFDETGYGGHQNDIQVDSESGVWPNDNQVYPSVMGVACGANGNVYAGGRMSLTGGGGANVFGFNDSGTLLWRANVGRVVGENCVTVDPSDDNVLVCGMRNDEWTGASGAQAHLFRLDKNTGAILQTIDLAESVRGVGVACNAEGRIVYGTGYVT